MTLPAEAFVTSKEIEVSWKDNDHKEPHHPFSEKHELDEWKWPVVVCAVEVFAGTFAEQWQEAGVVVSLDVPRADKPAKTRRIRLARFCPHKHGGCNLVAANAHGDTKGIPEGHGGVYYDACLYREIVPRVVPPGSVLRVGYDMAEPGRGLHLGCLLYGYRA